MISSFVRAIQAQMPHLAEEGYEDQAHITPIRSQLLKKTSLALYTVALVAIIGWEALQLAAPNGTAGKNVSIELTRGKYSVLDFKPNRAVPRAVILFGSGDGGWSGFEEAICRSLASQGYETVGIDFYAYAKTDYSLPVLQYDFNRIAQTIRGKYGSHAPPLIIGGWSMGAGQAIAACGGPHPPRGLIGLLLLDPCGRGRYGLRVSDRADLLPTGPNTFSMDEFTKTIGKARVVQWHATEDSIDSRAWLKDLTAPHREFDFGQTGHYYNRDRGDFLSQMVSSLDWIMEAEVDSLITTGSQG